MCLTALGHQSLIWARGHFFKPALLKQVLCKIEFELGSLADSSIQQLESHFVCPSFRANRTKCIDLFQDVEGPMHLFKWLRDGKAPSH